MEQPLTLFVSAAHEDRPCPKIRTRRGPINRKTGRDMSVIYHDEVVEVPNVRYYRRRIVKGDLVEASTSKAEAPKPKGKSKKSEE